MVTPPELHVHARHYATGEMLDLLCAGGAIAPPEAQPQQPVRLEASWVAPALFDLQVNGCDGRGFSSEQLTVADVRHIVAACHRHGVGSLCPTLITNSREALLHGFTVLHRACVNDEVTDRSLPAFHLEGPYISPEDGPRGAHPRQHVRPPDWDEFRRFQGAAGGRIRLVTLAPEVEGALSFIERLVASGVVVAVGHTAAGPAVIRDAVCAGARLSTHLGNGSHAMLPRHENHLWEQMAADELTASIICDGHHLPPALVRCLVRVKTPGRIVLTCDASPLAGLPPGVYEEWGQKFEVRPEGKVVVPGTTYLAGSACFTDTCVRLVMRYAGVSLAEAVDMAGQRPRHLLGLPARSLAPGEPADLVLFEHGPGAEFQITAVVIGGRRVTA
jgi:N-acetylglucosamine-6-phosphate deacetylase